MEVIFKIQISFSKCDLTEMFFSIKDRNITIM